MRIAYAVGFGTRIIDEWGVEMNQENGWTQDISEPGVIAELLTYPDGSFRVANDEPLLQIVNNNNAHVMALVQVGITTVHMLAAATEAQRQALAAAAEESAGVIDQWVTVAQSRS